MRDSFNKQLDELDADLIQMGTLCEQAIEAAVQILLEDKESNLKQVISIRDRIDKESRIVEDSCMKMLIRQQPVARDMNTISHALKLIRDMQRIGNQTAELALIARDVDPDKISCFNEITSMSETAMDMVSASIRAYVKKSAGLARKVIIRDDELDRFYREIKETLSSQVFLDKEETGNAIDILLIAKYLERIGDHTVNIAKWVSEIAEK